MLSLYKLEIFDMVVALGSFSAAAERLYMSQPAVSQHIRDLEAGLGTSLFIRERRGVTLTAPGKKLHAYTRSILRLVAEAENAVTDVAHLPAGQVVIAATPGIGVYQLPEWVQAFRVRYPNLTASVQTDITPRVLADLRTRRAEIGFIEGEIEDMDLTQIKTLTLEEHEQLVIVGRNHPWHDRMRVTCAELDGKDFIMRQPTSQTRVWLDRRLHAAGIRVNVTGEFDNVESIKRAVARSTGLTILPDYAVQNEVESGTLAAIAIEGSPLQRTLRLAWHADGFFSPVTRAFLTFLNRNFPHLTQLPNL
ncbi:MAG: LysR family transcriptional regulator [Caldilineaceae bacterium]|nr:LysR family transcriptional regulator [Caldilineaceae bacterium]